MKEAYFLGASSIGITGGEPMMNEHIVDIISQIPDGIEGVLYTTGFQITPEFLENVSHTNLTRCVVN